MEITSNDNVLFVDDEKLILQTIRRGLMEEEYTPFFANSGAEALEILKNEDIAVIVTDLKMPKMNGLELLEIVQKKYSSVTRIVLTGYYQVSTILKAINSGHVHRYLTKPWKMDEEFLPTIRQGIEYHNIIIERQELINKLSEQNACLKKQNDEITKLKELAETSDKNKTKILNHITETILPFMTDISLYIEKLNKSNSPELKEQASYLIERGAINIELLSKLKILLE